MMASSHESGSLKSILNKNTIRFTFRPDGSLQGFSVSSELTIAPVAKEDRHLILISLRCLAVRPTT